MSEVTLRAQPACRIAVIAVAAWAGAASAAMAQQSYDTVGNWVVTAVVIAVCIIAGVIYFVPTIVAFRRQHPNRWPIFVINLTLGGTGLGWFGSLVWACGAVHKSSTGSDGGESGLNLFINDTSTVRIEPSNGAALSTADPVERLYRLKTLFDAGVISADEHATLRKPLLDILAAST